jgi:hypothetical protein
MAMSASRRMRSDMASDTITWMRSAGASFPDAGEDRGQKLGRVEMGGGDRDDARDLLALAAGGERGGMGGLGHGAEMIDKREARLGQFHAFSGTGEEADAQLLLQRVTCRPSVGCVRPKARAAAEREPVSAVTTAARARFQSKVVFSNPCENVWLFCQFRQFIRESFAWIYRFNGRCKQMESR